ncbi:MAG: MFS transporter [Alphaproteobacteria bacterium]
MTAEASEILRPGASSLGRFSWALFEWGRNPYVQLITIFIYAPYFAREIVGDPVEGQALWGAISGYSGLLVALLAPVLGAIADAGGRRKPWIAFYSVFLAVASWALWFGTPGTPILAVGAVIALATVAYEFSTVFHNAMLDSVAQPKHVGALSGLGYALGNVASVLLLVFALLAFYLPQHPLLGLDRAAFEHERIMGPLVAAWLLVFSLPLFLWTPDRPSAKLSWMAAVRAGLRSVVRTIRSLRHYRNVGIYLVARAIYNDGKTAVLTFGGVYAAGVFHWQAVQMAAFGILLCVFAAVGGLLGGKLADAIGPKSAILVSIGGTMAASLLSLGFAPGRIFFFFAPDPSERISWLPVFQTLPELLYLGVVVLIAVFIVAAYACSRTMLARIAPRERMAEFFGLYALSGTATAFVAPLTVGALTALSGSQQWGMAAILLFLALGFAGMFFVREERASAV